MDNERPIEKLLRRFAKKRRNAAGDNFELHPATRRVLQGEVARQFPKQDGAAPEERGFRFWPVLVYATCVLVVIGLVAIAVLPMLDGSESRSGRLSSSAIDDPAIANGLATNGSGPLLLASGSVETMDKQKSDGVRQQGLVRHEAPLEMAEFKRFPEQKIEREATAAAPAQAGDGPVESLALAKETTKSETAARRPATAAPQPTTVAAAEAAPADAETARFARREVTPARAAPTAPTVSASGVSAAEFVNRSNTTDGKLFAGQAGIENQVANFRNVAAPPPAVPVLASFKVEQRGDELRVIDQDGSTYEGNIVPVTAPSDSAAARYFSDAAQPRPETPAPRLRGGGREATTLGVNAEADSTVQNYLFRVEGTNRTLRQQVVFTGNFVNFTNAAQFGIPPQNAPQQNLRSVINNSTIIGRAQLADDREISVNAVPVAQ
jgi:hypothetical protein